MLSWKGLPWRLSRDPSKASHRPPKLGCVHISHEPDSIEKLEMLFEIPHSLRSFTPWRRLMQGGRIREFSQTRISAAGAFEERKRRAPAKPARATKRVTRSMRGD